MPHPALERRRVRKPRPPGENAAVFEEEKRGDFLHAELARKRPVLVDIDLHEADFGFGFVSGAFEDPPHRPALTAPRRPEMGDGWYIVALDMVPEPRSVERERASVKELRLAPTADRL